MLLCFMTVERGSGLRRTAGVRQVGDERGEKFEGRQGKDGAAVADESRGEVDDLADPMRTLGHPAP
jgi:hypothetical protein